MMLVRLREILTTTVSELQPPAELKHPLPVALLAAAAATAVRFALDPVVRDHSTFLYFAIAVVIAALYGGAWAGIGVILLTLPLADYFFIEPRYTWFIHDAKADSVTLISFALLGALTTLIIHRFHESRWRLKQSLTDLRRSEFKLEMTAATVPEIIFSARDNGAAEYLNGYLANFCGIELPILLGSGWLDYIHPEDRGAIEGNFSGRRDLVDEFEMIVRLRRADGMYRSFKCHARRVFDTEEKASKWFGVLSDIENEKTLTAELESRTQELLRLNEALEGFAYTASHDLQEPLRTIGAMTELFLSRCRGDLDKESTEILAAVVKGVDRMERLIHDIMEFAKAIDAAAQAKSDVDTCAIVELAIANLAQAIHESGAKITVDQLPAVHANETAVLRLFQNIIANAIKYRADRPPEIHISVSQRDEGWLFSIRDNGIGIAPKYFDKIFEPFRRLHERTQYEGSGLGLAACRRIVQALKGNIWVESTQGEGSTFFFTIPENSPQPGARPKSDGFGADGYGHDAAPTAGREQLEWNAG